MDFPKTIKSSPINNSDIMTDRSNNSILTSTSTSSQQLPMWKRKGLESNDSVANISREKKTPTTTPRATKRPKTPNHDRFIPNRSAMDMDVSRHALNFDGKENGSSIMSSLPLDTTSSSSLNSSNNTNNNNNINSVQMNDINKNISANNSSPYSSIITASLLDKPACSSSFPLTNNSTAGNTNVVNGKQTQTPTNDLMHSKILTFTDKAPMQKEGYLNPNRVLYSQSGPGTVGRRHKFRHIPQKPEKILDAPNLLEDYYLNLVDWGSNNILAVALAESVYLWHADTGAIDQLCETSGYDDCITSVSFIDGGNYLAVGTNSHEVQIWDVERMRQLRTMRSHRARVGALSWNSHLLSSGARDGSIHHHDVRLPNHHVASLKGHTQEVCGLKWSPNGQQLASGSNDNTVCIWDTYQQQQSSSSSSSSISILKPKHVLTSHSAAVKALAWCPWQSNLLATGGGTADRQLRFWNTATGTCVNSIDTKSQVCSIVWNPHDKELLTSHGFSQNQLTVWKYPSLTRMAELKGHTSRVLHTALSPDGQTVVSGAADETLRFWKVFADSSSKGRRDAHGGDKGPLSSNTRSVSIR